MVLEGMRVRDDSAVRDESRDHAFPPPTISHGVEEGRVGVPLEQPIQAAPLAPVGLLGTGKVGKLALKVITKGPALVIKARGVSHSIKALDLGKEGVLKIAALFPEVGSPASQELTDPRGDLLPGINRVEGGAQGPFQGAPFVRDQLHKVRSLKPSLFEEEARATLLEILPGAQDQRGMVRTNDGFRH